MMLKMARGSAILVFLLAVILQKMAIQKMPALLMYVYAVMFFFKYPLFTDLKTGISPVSCFYDESLIS